MLVLFTLLRDGERFFTWLRAVVPLSEHVQREPLRELDALVWASVIGNVAVAGVQAVLLGIGSALLGVPRGRILDRSDVRPHVTPLAAAFGVWIQSHSTSSLSVVPP